VWILALILLQDPKVADLAKEDRPESADKLVALAGKLEKDLDALLPPIDPEPIPLENKQNVRWVLVWRKFADSKKQAEILKLEETRKEILAALRGFSKEPTLKWMLDALAVHPDRVILAEASHADERFMTALIERVKKDESWRVRAAAVEALVERKSKEAIDALKSALSSKEWPLRLTVLLSIPKLADVALTPALLRGLKDERWELRCAALNGLLASRDRTTAPAVVGALKDPQAEVRALALQVIAALGHRSVLPELVPLLKDSDKSVREAAVLAIEAKRGLRALVAATSELAVRAEALAAIERINSKAAVGPLIEALKDAGFDVKTRIMKTLETLTGAQKKNEREWKTYWDQEYRKAAAEFDGAIELKTIRGLAVFDRKEAAERLVKGLASVEGQLRSFVQQKDQLLREQQGIPDVQDSQGKVVPAVVRTWQEYFDKQTKLQEKISGLAASREAILEALSGMGEKETIDWMLKRLAKSQEEWERQGLMAAMAGADPSQVVAALIERLGKEKDAALRVTAIDSLAALRAQEAVTPITAALADPHWAVQLAAILALEQILGKKAVPKLIETLSSAEGRMASEIRDALTRLTGLDRGTVDGWKEWWKNYGESFLSGEARGTPPETEFKEGPKLPTFYGFTVNSKRVIFIVDRSGSMLEESEWMPPAKDDKPDGKRRIDVAKYELRTVLKMLAEDAYFNVILFSEGARPWQQTLVPATRANREAAMAWAQALPAEGGTNTWDSLELAFQIPGPKNQGADTIFFVSDGQPSVGRLTDPNEILAELARLNRARRVRINTITIGKEGSGIDPEFLKRMAEENFGSSIWRR
jgi:HEAT repeat protein